MFKRYFSRDSRNVTPMPRNNVSFFTKRFKRGGEIRVLRTVYIYVCVNSNRDMTFKGVLRELRYRTSIDRQSAVGSDMRWAASESKFFTPSLVFAGVLLVARYVRGLKHIRTLPSQYVPGVPIFDLSFIKDMHLQFNTLAKKHGSMFNVRLDTRFIVVLSDSRITQNVSTRELHRQTVCLLISSTITTSSGCYVFKTV